MRYSVFGSLKIIPAALLLFLVLVAGTCKNKNKNGETMTKNLALLEKTWLHSHEEDKNDTLVYRPNSFDFPPARGRTGFKMDADGTFHQYDIAPTDGLEELPGRWEMASEKLLNVTFPNKKATDFQAEIISITPDMLKVKRTFKQ
jgi:hypothetical protein